MGIFVYFWARAKGLSFLMPIIYINMIFILLTNKSI